MSKKSFKNEPALQFMSNVAPVSKAEPPAGKKESESRVSASPEDVRIGEHTTNHSHSETKSKRFHMLMRPALFEYLQGRAKERNISVNEFIHSILEVYIEDEKQKTGDADFKR